MEILEKITVDANYFQLKGDIEFECENYQEATKYIIYISNFSIYRCDLNYNLWIDTQI